MWKIIKTELAYIKWWIIISCSALVILIVVLKVNKLIKILNYGYDLDWSFTYSFGDWGIAPFYIQFVCAFVTLVLFYSYIKDRRLRQYAVLPVKTYNLIFAPIGSLFIICTIYAAIGIINSPVFILDLLEFKQYTDFNDPYWPLEIFESIYGFEYFMSIPFSLIILPWLFNERWGRIYVIAVAAAMVINGYIIPLFNVQLSWTIVETLQDWESVCWPVYLILNPLLMLLLYFSFRTRRTFLS